MFFLIARKYKACSKSQIPALGGMVSLLGQIVDNKDVAKSLQPKKVMLYNVVANT